MERYDFYVHQGETFRKVLRLRQAGIPLNLTGCIARSQVRTEPNGGRLLCEMEITLTPEEGMLTLLIRDDLTSAFDPDVFVWDLKLTDVEGITRYYVGGKFTVFPSVTE